MAFYWWLNSGDSKKLGEEKTCGVGCYVELIGLKYTRRHRLGGFIVIHLPQLFILVEFSNGWLGERFLSPELGFSSSITLCGVMCSLLSWSLFPLSFYIAMLV